MTTIFTPLGSTEFAAGALELQTRLAAGGERGSWCVIWSFAKCLKGMHDQGLS